MSNDGNVPPGAAYLRFGMRTPYWPLTLSYGIFVDPNTRLTFASLDHWLGYHMLARQADRERIMLTPNGFLAWQNLSKILETTYSIDGDTVVSPTWEQDRDNIMAEGLRLKYSQSACLSDMLLRTGSRPIIDDSRHDEPYWCYVSGDGKNRHGDMLVDLREKIRAGALLFPSN